VNYPIVINSTDYWVKIVEMLQQNWALIEYIQNSKYKVYFISDDSTVFDEIYFDSYEEAEKGLRRNGFEKYKDEKRLHTFLIPPKSPFREGKHPNGPIYSSGKYWR